MIRQIALFTVFTLSLHADAIDGYVDANDSNTAAPGGTPSPFWSNSSNTGNLWKKRTGFGFDVLDNTEIFEKDTNSGVGNATPLETIITGLTPGQQYGIYVCFLSVPSESWRVSAGLSSDQLTEFTPNSPMGRITDLGKSSVAGSNRNQYLGFIGNTTAQPSGDIVVHIDDGNGTNSASRTWYEGLAFGDPYEIPEPPPLPGGAVEIAPDGAWTWFNDERSIFHQGILYSGYVRSDGYPALTRYDPDTGSASHMQLGTNAAKQIDDHNNPSLTILPDGHLLAVYSRHGPDDKFFYRRSKNVSPATETDWNPELEKITPARNTYANTYRLTAESNLIYNLHRCINWNPTLTRSSDDGATWDTPVQVINASKARPYPRYISNHSDRIDMIYTDGHPRDLNNSIYHLYYQADAFHHSDGTVAKTLANLPLNHDSGERGTVVYQYSGDAWGPEDGPDDWIPTGRGWTWDIHYGADNHPVCAFQVQRDDVTGSGWNHDRIYYYYARWTGTTWQHRFIAHGGRGLYSHEDDYGGGMCIDPEDPRIVYISTNAADPFSLGDIDNVPLASDERYEIYRGFTADGGLSFSWQVVTDDSPADNLRPIVPENHQRTRQLTWFYGTYNTYTSYSTQVIAIFDEKKETLTEWQASFALEGTDPAATDSDQDGLADLLEYALGGDPTDPADRPVPTLADNKFSFNHLPTRTDTEQIVETSTDLVNWTSIATIRAADLPNEVAAGYILEIDATDPQIISISPTPPPRSFIRLRVLQLP